MPTNDERREVAARLRDMAVCEHISDVEDFGMVIRRAFREMVPIPRSHYSFLRTIADLIEPEPERTCHVVERYEASHRAEIGRERVKLSCGHIVERHSKFCPSCGAKVVEQ